MPPKAKVRRRSHREEARRILEGLVAGKTADIFVAYGQLFSLSNGNDPVLRELRPLFSMPGIGLVRLERCRRGRRALSA